MITLGLTGSIGMGKSTVSRMFAAQGVPVFDSDGEVHDMLDHSEIVKRVLRKKFPAAVRDGKVDREKLGKIVFKNPDKLKELETLLHPKVMSAMRRFLDHHKNAPLAVLDVPLLFETGTDRICDYVVTVSVSPAIQKKRVLKREGMTAEKFNRILARQMPAQEKNKRADFVIDTSGPHDQTRATVEKLIHDLKTESFKTNSGE